MPVLKVKNNGIWEYVAGGMPDISDCIVAYGDIEPTDTDIKIWYDTSEPDVGIGNTEIILDTTLTQAGVAADAAAVGAAFAEIDNKLSSIIGTGVLE